MTDLRCVIDRETDRTGSAVRLYLHGQFDATAGRTLGRVLRDVLQRSRPVGLVIDVGGVESLSSECVDVLLVGYVRALRGGHGFHVVNGHGPVLQILEATSLCERSDDVLYVPAWSDGDAFMSAAAAGADNPRLLSGLGSAYPHESAGGPRPATM